MIYFKDQLKDKYSSYRNVNAKVKHEVDAGRLIRLKKGVYTDSPNEDPFLCANALIRPSYISFYSALSYHGLIPERVYETMSAVCLLNKNKKFGSSGHRFSFYNIPKEIFSFGVDLTSGGFSIASAEKALADTLYFLAPVHSITSLKELLFEDLRIDEYSFDLLKKDELIQILPLYKSTNTTLLMKLLEEKDGKRSN